MVKCEILQTLVDAAPCGLFYLKWDPPTDDFRFIFVNDFGKKLAELEDIEGRLLCQSIEGHRDPIKSEDNLSLYEIYKAIAFKQEPYTSGRREARLEFNSAHFGGRCWFDQIVQYVADGEIVIGSTNCTADVERQQQLQQIVELDSLTKAYSRHATLNRLSQECSRVQDNGGSLGLLMLDVDDFKRINDHCGGHTVGDKVLKALCQRAQTCLRKSIDRLGRLGGDEFLIIVPDVDLEAAIGIARRILETIKRPFDPTFTISVGVIEVVKVEGLTADELHEASLQRVDRALYKAKETGKAQISH